MVLPAGNERKEASVVEEYVKQYWKDWISNRHSKYITFYRRFLFFSFNIMNFIV